MASIDDLKSSLEGDGSSSDAVSPSGRVEFVADTIEEILEDACKHFGTARIGLDYEIIQRSKGGFLGFGKRPFKLLVWVSGQEASLFDASDIGDSEDGGSDKGDDFSSSNIFSSLDIDDSSKDREDISKYINGVCKILVRKKGIFLNVSSPRAGGKAVSLEDAQFALAGSNIKKYSLKKIKNIVEKSKGEYVKIGEWTANTNFDSRALVEIGPDEMSASVTISSPILSGRVLEKEEIYDLLKENGVVHGILEDEIDKIFEEELYDVPVVVVKGDEVVNGLDAKIDYKFAIDDQVKFEEDESGRVDYKELDLLQNVVSNQLLAIKITATRGQSGKTVLGNFIEAIDGEDITFSPGENAVLSDNGLEILAKISGRALIRGGLVCVDPIYEVKGDVNLNTGNIIFLGTVIVKGSVSDGFTVKAAGDLEIRGSVGRAEIEADGEIIVGQGILGKDGGFVKAGTNLFAKFVENSNIYAGNDVIVKEEILHSKVDAGGRIICHGRKGIILGGRLRAGYEISAKSLGSNAYTDTILEAGTDPKYKEKLVKLEEELLQSEQQLTKIKANVSTLQRYKDAGNISKEKAIMLGRFIEARDEFELQCREIKEDIEELDIYLNSLDNTGLISSKVHVFPGVDITIKGANLLVKNEFSKVSFINQNELIKSIPYKPFDGETTLSSMGK